MAKINLTFDTSTKELSVSMDGEALSNISGVHISKGYSYDEKDDPKFYCNLMTVDSSKQKDEGYVSMTQIVAKQSVEAASAMENGAVEHPKHKDFLLLKDASSRVKESISKMMKNRREASR